MSSVQPAASESKPKLNRKERQELAKAKAEKKKANEASSSPVKDSSDLSKQLKQPLKNGNNLVKSKASGETTRSDIESKASPIKLVKPVKGEKLSHDMKNFDLIMQYYENKSIHLHPLIIKVGLQMSQGIIKGSAKRCLAMLIALKAMAHDLEISQKKDYLRTFQSNLDSSVNYLEQCRQLSVSMTNAIRYIKTNSTMIPATLSESECRKLTESLIEKYINEYQLAIKAIIRDGSSKIEATNEVILTYGDSLLVRNLLMKAYTDGKRFRVVVVDSRPRFLGKSLAKFFVNHNIATTYVPISAIAYVMKEVTKVVIGAHAMLTNGYVMASLGTSQVALVAQAFNVPVLVCCETLNFSERAHIDSYVFNEEGPKEDFFDDLDQEKSLLQIYMESNVASKDKQPNFGLKTSLPDSHSKPDSKNTRKPPRLKVLNYFYDITPSSLVSLVITEKGLLPCSSVSAVIRKNYGRF